MRSRTYLAILLVTALVLAALPTGTARAASLVEVTNFGTNPTGLRMYLYVPNNVAARPAILLALHYCTGTGPAFYSGTEFASLADRYGFIVIYPSATRSPTFAGGGGFAGWSALPLSRRRPGKERSRFQPGSKRRSNDRRTGSQHGLC